MRTSQGEKTGSNSKAIIILLIIAMVVFAIVAGIMFYKGFYVKNTYYNGTNYGTNAYVGGDAYNFIINGTYFTGYSTIGTGCMICAVLCGIGSAVVVAVKKRETGASNVYVETKNHSVTEDIESELPEI